MDVIFGAVLRERLAVRSAGVLFGVITQLLFAIVVWYLFHFLKGTTGASSENALLIDVILALQFATTHSLWLWPPVRKRLGRWISRSFYGCFFCLMTCLSLGLVFWQWRTIPGMLWQTTGTPAATISIAFMSSWIALLYSLALTGLGYQTGLTEWLHWVRRQPLPPRTFHPRGAHRIMRHPVYLSFLALLWFTPTMTNDHAILTGIWTIYIYFGSCLKDRRLAHYLGNSYRDYAAQVPGYPGMVFGPLARWRPLEDTGSSVVSSERQPSAA